MVTEKERSALNLFSLSKANENKEEKLCQNKSTDGRDLEQCTFFSMTERTRKRVILSHAFLNKSSKNITYFNHAAVQSSDAGKTLIAEGVGEVSTNVNRNGS
jgi:hypothetical protein